MINPWSAHPCCHPITHDQPTHQKVSTHVSVPLCLPPLPTYPQPWRTDIKPLNIVQPEGPSFTVDGWRVQWQKWDFRLGGCPRV